MKYVIVVLALLAGFTAGVSYKEYILDYSCKTYAKVVINNFTWSCSIPRLKGKSWPVPSIKNRDQYDWSDYPNELPIKAKDV